MQLENAGLTHVLTAMTTEQSEGINNSVAKQSAS
jgi:hypothetical protein